MKKQQSGFTLIELIMVIVVLGILAAFALPKFANFGADARAAAINGAAGAARSAAAIVHSAYLAGQSQAGDEDDDPRYVLLEGEQITVNAKGYPTADETGIMRAASLAGDFSIDSGVIKQKGSVGAACNFTYTLDSTTGVPSFTVSGRTGDTPSTALPVTSADCE